MELCVEYKRYRCSQRVTLGHVARAESFKPATLQAAGASRMFFCSSMYSPNLIIGRCLPSLMNQHQVRRYQALDFQGVRVLVIISVALSARYR
jgi:hypothetical protein